MRRGVRAGGAGTLSQSDYTGLCARMRVQGLLMQGVHAGVVGTLSQSDYTGLRMQGLRMQGLRMQGLRAQGLHAQGCIEESSTSLE